MPLKTTLHSGSIGGIEKKLGNTMVSDGISEGGNTTIGMTKASRATLSTKGNSTYMKKGTLQSVNMKSNRKKS